MVRLYVHAMVAVVVIGITFTSCIVVAREGWAERIRRGEPQGELYPQVVLAMLGE